MQTDKKDKKNTLEAHNCTIPTKFHNFPSSLCAKCFFFKLFTDMAGKDHRSWSLYVLFLCEIGKLSAKERLHRHEIMIKDT